MTHLHCFFGKKTIKLTLLTLLGLAVFVSPNVSFAQAGANDTLCEISLKRIANGFNGILDDINFQFYKEWLRFESDPQARHQALQQVLACFEKKTAQPSGTFHLKIPQGMWPSQSAREMPLTLSDLKSQLEEFFQKIARREEVSPKEQGGFFPGQLEYFNLLVIDMHLSPGEANAHQRLSEHYAQRNLYALAALERQRSYKLDPDKAFPEEDQRRLLKAGFTDLLKKLKMPGKALEKPAMEEEKILMGIRKMDQAFFDATCTYQNARLAKRNYPISSAVGIHQDPLFFRITGWGFDSKQGDKVLMKPLVKIYGTVRNNNNDKQDPEEIATKLKIPFSDKESATPGGICQILIQHLQPYIDLNSQND